MQFYIYGVEEAEKEFNRDNSLTNNKQISSWAEQYIIKHSKGLDFQPIIAYGEKGKPFFQNNNSLHFSISHTQGYIAICFHNKPIGIDIEYLRKAKKEIVQRFFHPKEYEYLNQIQDQIILNQEFTRIWTLKEAFVKCTGEGIANNFKAFAIKTNTQVKDNIQEIEIEFETPQETKYQLFHQYLEENNLYLSICKEI